MDSKVKEEITKAIESMRDEMIDNLQKLVRIPSVVGNEGETQKFIQKQFENAGLEVCSFEADREKIKDHPAFVDSDVSYIGRPNIIGTLKGDFDKNSIILNAHTDVVSPEPISQWNQNPWGGEVDGNRLYGRGALDCKAGLIVNIYAIKALQNIGIKPQGAVILQSVIEEEAGGGGGTLACLIEGYTGDGMIITEPFPNVCICRAGVVYFRVKIRGKSDHAGRAHLGVNAIGKMLKIYQALDQLDTKRAAIRFPMLEKWSGRCCHVGAGTIRAGEGPSIVPGFAQMECRISFVPGEEREKIKKTVVRTILDIADSDPWLQEHPPLIEWFGFQTDPEYYDPLDPFVKTVVSSAEKIMKKKIEVVGRPAPADTRFSQYFGFPSVTFGADGGNPHGINEYVDLESLQTAAKIVALTTLDWCSKDKK